MIKERFSSEVFELERLEPVRSDSPVLAAVQTAISPLGSDVVQRADATISLSGGTSGPVAARCSLWWSKTPLYNQQKVGYIGHFAAESLSNATELLDVASSTLRDNGCQYAIGPVDGSTWHNYRFVTIAGDLPFFIGEPRNPSSYPDLFLANGFTVTANYFSTITEDLSVATEHDLRYLARMEQAGITIRQLDLEKIEDELRTLYKVSKHCFADNFLYQDIDLDEFLALYRPLVSMLDPRLVLIAEDEKAAVGFIFLLPDRVFQGKVDLSCGDCGDIAASRGARTTIVKTAARLPHTRYAGLGSALLLRAREAARQLGYSRAIHALMHENNSSLKICSRYGHVIRRYSLFSKSL